MPKLEASKSPHKPQGASIFHFKAAVTVPKNTFHWSEFTEANSYTP